MLEEALPNHPLSISCKLLLVPERCPSKEAVIESCSTCCCNSSRDVEFYDPKVPEHNTVCNVDTIANYTVTFVGTWTEGCHPDYYLDDAHWSPLTGVSHDPSYEVWNGCMYNVSLGVERVSRFGATNTIESEYTAQGSKVFDRLKGDVIFPGAGMTARNLLADANHSYVSVLTMLAPSADRMMGVSRCNSVMDLGGDVKSKSVGSSSPRQQLANLLTVPIPSKLRTVPLDTSCLRCNLHLDQYVIAKTVLQWSLPHLLTHVSVNLKVGPVCSKS